MSISLPELRVSEPVRHGVFAVFPLFSVPNGAVNYRLADEALAEGHVAVAEVSEAGSVPDLLVENKGDLRILFIEGEELVGAKQNRVLNTSVLVAAHTKTKIPVSCVERGRWRFTSHAFQYSGSQSPSLLRRVLKGSVSRSLKANLGHRSDQGEVWAQVDQLNCDRGVDSETQAMSDAYDAYRNEIDQLRERLKYVEGATGMAVAVRDRVISVDVFDKPETCRKVWSRMLSGLIFDAGKEGENEGRASTADVEQTWSMARNLNWVQATAVGEGAEYRAESSKGDHASALVLDGSVVHASVITGV